jgi:hypothetical protein
MGFGFPFLAGVQIHLLDLAAGDVVGLSTIFLPASPTVVLIPIHTSQLFPSLFLARSETPLKSSVCGHIALEPC